MSMTSQWRSIHQMARARSLNAAARWRPVPAEFIGGTCRSLSCNPADRVAVNWRIKLREVRNFHNADASRINRRHLLVSITHSQQVSKSIKLVSSVSTIWRAAIRGGAETYSQLSARVTYRTSTSFDYRKQNGIRNILSKKFSCLPLCSTSSSF